MLFHAPDDEGTFQRAIWILHCDVVARQQHSNFFSPFLFEVAEFTVFEAPVGEK